ncbi:unnamed protein product [Orchesella dallaii]|uniref:Uncharacterized protein n=1 Tax=Orchesella dallaii TaxID=48710 RepID=A0ABP1S5T1_9HEXA
MFGQVITHVFLHKIHHKIGKSHVKTEEKEKGGCGLGRKLTLPKASVLKMFMCQGFLPFLKTQLCASPVKAGGSRAWDGLSCEDMLKGSRLISWSIHIKGIHPYPQSIIVPHPALHFLLNFLLLTLQASLLNSAFVEPHHHHPRETSK